MIVSNTSSVVRRGITLLEVLVSLAIFLMSLIAIGHLIGTGADLAIDVKNESRASQLCQSKLHEVVWGIEPLSSSSGTFDLDDSDWQWTVDCEQGNIANLWNVTVTVRRETNGGSPVEFTLSQMVLDPSVRGSTFDTPAADTTPDTNTAGGSSGSAGAGGASGGASGGGAAAGARGGAASRSPTSGGAGAMPTGGAGAMPTGGGATRPTSGGTPAPTTGTPTAPRSGSATPRTGP
jgi:general secretion pathway protein I